MKNFDYLGHEVAIIKDYHIIRGILVRETASEWYLEDARERWSRLSTYEQKCGNIKVRKGDRYIAFAEKILPEVERLDNTRDLDAWARRRDRSLRAANQRSDQTTRVSRMMPYLSAGAVLSLFIGSIAALAYFML